MARTRKRPAMEGAAKSIPASTSAHRAPFISFPGEVIYAGNEVDITSACRQLLCMVRALPAQRKLLVGFDMEWQYMPHEQPPALIQLCVRTSAAHTSPHCLDTQQDTSTSLTQQHRQQPGSRSQQAECGHGHSSTQQQERQKQQQERQQKVHPETQQQQQQQVPEGAGFVCYLLHLARLGHQRSPTALKQLLEHPQVFLITCGDRDEEKLQQDLGIHPPNLEQVNMMHFLLRQQQRRSHHTPAAQPPAQVQAAGQPCAQGDTMLHHPKPAVTAGQAGVQALAPDGASSQCPADRATTLARLGKAGGVSVADVPQPAVPTPAGAGTAPPSSAQHHVRALHMHMDPACGECGVGSGPRGSLPAAAAKARTAAAAQSAAQQAAARQRKRQRRSLPAHHSLGGEASSAAQGPGAVVACEVEPMGPAGQGCGLSHAAGRVVTPERISLASLVGLYLGLRMDKRCQLDGGAWEQAHLSQRHTRYAATDAYAQLLVFEELRVLLRSALHRASKGDTC
ncbi:hypothetical protein V8C86DRAFT_2496600 [Haematococcus lacustris]